MAQIKLSDTEIKDIAMLADLPYAWGKLKNSTVVISGGTGFIGSYLIAVLQMRNKKYNDNISIVSLSRGGGEDCENVKYMSCDVTQSIAIKEPVDYVLHLASNTHPQQYAKEPVETITTNILGCCNLIELAREKKAKRFLLTSSVEIYGNGSDTPMQEDYCGYINCNTVRAGYNEAKRVSESLCQAYIAQFGMDCVIARLARVFGPDRKNDSKAIAQFMQNAVRGENIVLKSKGNQRFSYCYVIDAVSGILKVLLDGESGEAYNISEDDEGLTLGDYANYIAALGKVKVVFDLTNRQTGASTAEYALISSIKIKNLEWQPMFTVKDGLYRTHKILTGKWV
ncbi:NAD-dependent epimerase/dehydratase family protein [Pumilibacter intestinalis]|uniref:NAD-dependent epimerase/dehydratase family protein n=1 Tax=Pumilibacter intestinalis TaxID=2941511 RepID=UPI00203D956F|nr:NAD-dependent epimerase/dehydratase family protein [Pumilibacter intestinalis]